MLVILTAFGGVWVALGGAFAISYLFVCRAVAPSALRALSPADNTSSPAPESRESAKYRILLLMSSD